MAEFKLEINTGINTVQDLLDQLNDIEDKSLPIFVYNDGDLLNIGLVDTDISDRVDITVI